jgi:hypothetical protein
MFDYNKASGTQLNWIKNNLKHLTVAGNQL